MSTEDRCIWCHRLGHDAEGAPAAEPRPAATHPKEAS